MMQEVKTFILNGTFWSVMAGALFGMSFVCYKDCAIERKCSEACLGHRLVKCLEHSWHEATAFCQDDVNVIVVHEVKR